MNDLTPDQKDEILVLHDVLLSFIEGKGLPFNITAPAVLMLCATFCSCLHISENEIIEEFGESLRKAKFRIATNQSSHAVKH